MDLLRIAGWLIAVVYSTIPCFWLVIHPRARMFGRARQPLLLAGLIWLCMWLVMGFGTWPFHRVLLYRSGWSWLAAAPFFVSGFGVYVMAKRRFTVDQLLGRTELHPLHHEQRLVTEGIRQYIRHPIYLGHFLELLAWSVATGMAVLYVMTAFAVLTGLVMVRLEDRELEGRFGAEYSAYRLRVPALIPRLRRR